MKKHLFTTIFCTALLAGCVAPTNQNLNGGELKVSEFGNYEGYSEAMYDGYDLESKYVATRDGTKLAVDIFYPTLDGVRSDKPLPVIFTMQRYWRSKIGVDGERKHILNGGAKAWKKLSAHGYIIIIVDQRGAGASFGQDPGSYGIQQAEDSFDIIEWGAKQPWSNGKAGMLGPSYLGGTQFTAAAQHPPSLKAILPASIDFNQDEAWGSGGVLRKVVTLTWASGNLIRDGIMSPDDDPYHRDWSKRGMIAPVDGPNGARLLQDAREEHGIITPENASERQLLSGKGDLYALYRPPFATAFTGSQSPGAHLAEINSSGIPIYYWGGWYDGYAGAALTWYNNLTGPKKVMNGPWTHGPNEKNDPREHANGTLYAIEALRWYDYWLKDIKNGIMDEPNMRYSVTGKDPHEWAWKTTNTWPDKSVDRHDFFLNGDSDGGALSGIKSTMATETSFVVDYTATTGKSTRYYDTMGGTVGGIHYPELSDLNSKGITYTGPILKEDMVVLGYPVVTLNVSSTAADGEFNVYLEKVTPDGKSHFVTDGVMRASRRVMRDAPYNFMGLPMDDGRKEVVLATPPLNTSGIVPLEFYLLPTGMVFEKGSRLRLAITGADLDMSNQKPVIPAPTHTIHTGGIYNTKISLPLLKGPDELIYKTWVYAEE